MVCSIWSGDEENFKKIKSIGSLYNKMLVTLGKRFVEKHDKYAKIYTEE